MRKRNALLIIMLVFVLPQILVQVLLRFMQPQFADDNSVPLDILEDIDADLRRTIRVKDQDAIMLIDLDEYITGVVLGEMPADFESEALKAQAVAARTFTLYNVLHNEKHQNANVCADSTCCQAFVSPEMYLGSAEDLYKVTKAVTDTSGEVITYLGELIDAVYFSSSGGKTEAALAVWGADVPYLQSVSSPGEEMLKNSEETVSITHAEFLKKLGMSEDILIRNEIIEVDYSDGGGVHTVTIGGKLYSGVEMRKLLNLRSTMFDIEIDDQNVIITTNGYGHRVGMSQYGAEAMAINGSDYKEIIKHYYLGTEIITLSDEQIDECLTK